MVTGVAHSARSGAAATGPPSANPTSSDRSPTNVPSTPRRLQGRPVHPALAYRRGQAVIVRRYTTGAQLTHMIAYDLPSGYRTGLDVLAGTGGQMRCSRLPRRDATAQSAQAQDRRAADAS